MIHFKLRRLPLYLLLVFAVGARVLFSIKPPSVMTEPNPSPLIEAERRFEKLRTKVSAQPENARAHFELAMAYGPVYYHLEAAEEFEKSIALGMDTAEVHNHLAYCYLNLGQIPRAIEEYKLAVKRDPSIVEYQLALARAYLQAGRADYAVDVLGHVASKESKSTSDNGLTVREMEQLAASYGLVAQNQKALHWGEKAIQKAPGYWGGYAVVGKSARALGQIETAIQAFRRGCKIAPEQAILHMLLGEALLQRPTQANVQEAYQHLKRAANLNPMIGQTFYFLGMALEKQELWGSAAHAFQRAAELRYEERDARLRAARMFIKAGARMQGTLGMARYYRSIENYEAALSECKRLISDPQYRIQGYIDLANVYLDLNRPDEAIATLKKGLSLQPKSFELHQQLALAYGYTEDLSARGSLLRKMIKLDPARADVGYRDLGSMYLSSSVYDKAEECFEKCVAQHPEDGSYRFVLAEAYMKRWQTGDRLQKAIEQYEISYVLNPNSAHNCYMLAICYMRAQRLDDSVRAFRRAINLDPGVGNYYRGLGEVLKKQKKHKEAKAMLALFRRYQRYLAQMQLLETRARARRNDPESQFQLAEFYIQSKDFSSAEGQLLRVIKLNPGHLRAHQRLASIYGVLARPEDQAREREIAYRLSMQEAGGGS